MPDTRRPQQGWVPVPDPTLLTTQLTEREIAHLKEFIQSDLTALRNLLDQRFANIDNRFIDLDKLRSMTALANTNAIAAALESQKEAATKTEATFSKQIDQLQVLLNAVSRATDEKIDDLKTRMDLSEGKSKGFGEGWGILVGAGGLIAGIAIALSHYIK